MQAAVFIFPGAEELDVFAPYEVLAVAGFDTVLMSSSSLEPVRLAKGAVVHPHRCYTDGYLADLLIVPGGGWANHAAVGVRSEAENAASLRLLRETHERGVVIGAVCTGAMLLERAGLLKGLPAITHHSAVEDLRAAGVAVRSARVVDAGAIVTSGGVTSGLDLALWLVERFAGRPSAEKVAAYLEYERRGEVWQAVIEAKS